MTIVGEIASNILLFCLVFGMSATVEMKSLKKQVQNRKALGIGVFMQFIVLPFVGFCVVKILNLPSTYGVILMVITSSPGGSYSNWWCSLFNAELALSVTMTTISTLLSVVMLPANLVLYTRATYSDDVVQHLDWTGLVISLVVVISGIGGGLYSSYRAEQRGDRARFHKKANRMGNVAGVLLVLLSVMLSSTGKSDGEHHKASLWDQDAKFYIGVALPAILGLGLAVKLSSHFELEYPERVAVAVEACYQNTGIATSVALSLYKGDELSTAIGVPLYYGIVDAVVLAFFCIVCWKMGWTKAPPNENFCTVIYNSYEVHDDDEPQQQQQQQEQQNQEGTFSNTSSTDHSKHDFEVDWGTTDADESDVAGSGRRKRIGVAETELTGRSTALVGGSTTDSPTAVVVSDGSAEEDELPNVSRWDRTMATIRARISGYGFGQQDEERGLRTRRGPVTLGLSHAPSPNPKKQRKQVTTTTTTTTGSSPSTSTESTTEVVTPTPRTPPSTSAIREMVRGTNRGDTEDPVNDKTID